MMWCMRDLRGTCGGIMVYRQWVWWWWHFSFRKIVSAIRIMNGNEGSNSLALYACLDHSLCDLIYIAIGKIMNNKICFCGRIVHCLYKLFTLGMSYLSQGRWAWAYTTVHLSPHLIKNSQSVLLSHRLVKLHVTVQVPKRLDLKPWASEYRMIMIHGSHYSYCNMMQSGFNLGAFSGWKQIVKWEVCPSG